MIRATTLVLLALLVLPGYALYGASWPDEAFPLPWWMSLDLPDWEQEADWEEAIHAAWDTWAEVECASLEFTYMGQADDAVFGQPDGRNVVFAFADGWPDESSLLTSQRLYSDAVTMVEADLALNAQHFAWATNGIELYDIRSAATHEIGHLLGLWHSAEVDATLNPALDGHPDGRDLAPDDIAGFCELYGAGDGAQGDSCVEAEDCADGMICLADGEDRYCTVECDGGAGCPDGYECLEAGGVEVCALAGGCSGCSAGPGRSPATLLVLLLAALAFRIRRRLDRAP